MVSSPVHHHTHTYPGAATGSPAITTRVVPGVPVVPPGVVTETPTVHHIHHLPRGKSRSRRDHQVSDSEDSESDEEYPAQRRYNFAILELCHVSMMNVLPFTCIPWCFPVLSTGLGFERFLMFQPLSHSRHVRVRSNTGNHSNWGGYPGDEVRFYFPLNRSPLCSPEMLRSNLTNCYDVMMTCSSRRSL